MERCVRAHNFEIKMIRFYVRIKTYFSTFSLKPRREFKTISDKADYDWRVILVIFILLSVSAVSVGTFLFIKVSKGEIFAVIGKREDAKSVINERGLKNVIDFFESRRTHVEELKKQPRITEDPSL